MDDLEDGDAHNLQARERSSLPSNSNPRLSAESQQEVLHLYYTTDSGRLGADRDVSEAAVGIPSDARPLLEPVVGVTSDSGPTQWQLSA
ncbi:hypothetical protein PGT21_011984 [Puccinia graminis f. sp. tritici]|uniref:Uncharacterized protein n=1 Tax=Puccinia graminis f. sp. tritici TaxID=56615 RepID=A0A5B0PXB2_PUCGR|nr:hypothetical protein PGT21_011984 [Puccinia graminis f. sp. tritici]